MSDVPETVQRNIFNDPENSVLAIFEKGTPVDDALKALREQGCEEDHITIADDNAEAELFGEKHRGPSFRKLLAYDEVEIERNYQEAVKLGHKVVIVRLSDDDETREQQRNEVRDILFAHDGTYVHYFGEGVFEEVMVASEDT